MLLSHQSSETLAHQEYEGSQPTRLLSQANLIIHKDAKHNCKPWTWSLRSHMVDEVFYPCSSFLRIQWTPRHGGMEYIKVFIGT